MAVTSQPHRPVDRTSTRRALRRRVVLGAVMVVVTVASTFATRLFLSLGALTHQNPFSAFADVLHGSGGSGLQGKIDRRERINIALYGYGGAGHDGPYLTDSMMMVSIQPQGDLPPQVAELSIPRDWYVPIDLGHGRTVHSRINEAFQDGVDGTSTLPGGTGSGAQLADGTLERVLGVHIDRYVGVDFTAFKDGVDSVGGIDIDVPMTFTDHEYPRGECGADGSGDCRYETVHFDAGPQHMDGAKALIYTRSRHSTDPGEGSDFARSRRQQLVLQALKAKVVSVGGLGHLPDLLTALGGHVSTDLSIGDGRALYELVKGVDHDRIHRVSIDDTNFLYECGFPQSCAAAYLFPHDDTYRSLSHFVSQLLPPQGVLDERTPVTVADASGSGGAASARWAGLMSSVGLLTKDAGAQRPAEATQVIDLSGGRHAVTAAWLTAYFGATAGSPTPPPGAAGADPGVMVVLGQDEERAFNRTSGTIDQSSGAGESSSTPTPTWRPQANRSATPAPTAAAATAPPRPAAPAATVRPFLNLGLGMPTRPPAPSTSSSSKP